MSRKRKGKQKKSNSPSQQRYALRCQALKKLPLRHEGIGHGPGDTVVRKITMQVLIGFARVLGDDVMKMLRLSSGMRHCLASMFADDLFERLGPPALQLFPKSFPVIEIDMQGLLVRWCGMHSVQTKRGPQFLPATEEARQPVLYRGIPLQPRFTKHAIARILERSHVDPSSWHAHDRTFNRLHLVTGALVPWERDGEFQGFAMWDATPNDPRFDYSPDPRVVDESFPVTDPLAAPRFDVWRLIGYLPCELAGPVAVAKTLLYPGMRGTPERSLKVDQALAELSAAGLSQLPEEDRHRLLRHLHAVTPQFRRFDADEAKAAGNTWVHTSSPRDRERFANRRRRNLLRDFQTTLELKRPA